MKKIIYFIILLSVTVSCVNTKSTLQNVDDTATIPQLSKYNTFVLIAYSKDPKYGYNKDYPINVFYRNTRDESINQERFLNALAGPKGEQINFKKLESCCPFPTKNSEMGAGFVDVYEITWQGQKKPLTLYVNMYDKGLLMVPMGLSLKKF